MSDELTALREEVTQLREETKSLRQDLRELFRLLSIPEDSFREGTFKALSLVVESVAVRSSVNPHSNAIYIGADESGGHIWLQDEHIRRRCSISANGEGALIAMENADGKTVLSIGETEKGNPQIYIAQPDGSPCAGLHIKDGQPIINIVDEKQRALVMMMGSEDGGELIVANLNGKPAVTQKATQRGGLVTTHEPGGQIMSLLLATSETGMIDVRGPQGAQAIVLTADDAGGAMGVMDAEGSLLFRLPPIAKTDEEGEEDDSSIPDDED